MTPPVQDFGFEITDMDASAPLSDGDFARLMQAIYAHGLVCLRDQVLKPAELERFAARLGTPNLHVEEDLRSAEAPGVITLSNTDGRPERQRNGGAFWHTDLVFTDTPASFTMLNAVAVPKTGGETLFADQIAAYDALPEKLRSVADDAIVIHCYEGRTDGSMPSVRQPQVRDHPITGRRALYGAAGTGIGVDGMAPNEARDYLDEIADHATAETFQYAHFYRLNDLVIWDNALTLHSGPVLDPVNSPDDDGARIMNRSSVQGWPEVEMS